MRRRALDGGITDQGPRSNEPPAEGGSEAVTLTRCEPIGQGGRLKEVIWVFLFAISVPIWYLSMISHELSRFQEALELRSASGIPIYLTTFQQWTFDILSLCCDALIVGIGVALLFYFIKGLPTYIGLLFGLLSRYVIPLGVLFVMWLKSPASFFGGVSGGSADLRLYVILSLQFLLTLVFSYIGAIYGQHVKYLDPRDQDLWYLGGVPKKIWFLLLLAFQPVSQFLSQLTILQIYRLTEKITSMAFWKDTFSFSNLFSDDSARGATGLLGHAIVIFFAWGLAAVLFSIGLHAIRNKEIKYRWLRICAVFVFLPVFIIAAPILRNRTWFF
jgi:hypothetical protein